MGWGWFGTHKPKESAFDRDEFRPLYSAFVDALMDSMHAGAPTAAPPSGAKDTPDRLRRVWPAAPRLVAIGDIHGDLAKLKQALTISGLVNADFQWIGGSTVMVQVGDLLDRGDAEIPILYHLERLQSEASRAGGAVHVLNGNHETMNIAGDFRYATTGANATYTRWYVAQRIGALLKRRCGCDEGWSSVPPLETGPIGSQMPRQEAQSCRWAALQPGGQLTRRFFANHPAVLQVGDSVFVHGGLHPDHLDIGVDRLNSDSQDWMLGDTAVKKPDFLKGRNAIVWSREYSTENEARCKCDMLLETLLRLSAKRMIVGHTIQDAGINTACQEQVVRVDVGMSRGCGGNGSEVLEIINDLHLYRIQSDGSRTLLSHQDQQWSALQKLRGVAAHAG